MTSIPERDYNQMVAQLHHQQRYIAALEAENRNLRRQLGELRRGVGITVTVHGQTMSLTAPVATVVSQSTEPDDSSITGIFPTMMPPADPAHQPLHTLPPLYPERPMPQHEQLAHNYKPGHWETNTSSAYGQMPGNTPEHSDTRDYAENGWLTGPTPAVRPPAHPVAPHVLRPSQQITPTWLRDEQAEWPALTTPAAPQRPHQRSDAERFSSLARLTGQHSILYPPENQPQHQQSSYPQQRNPYTDSFVLG